jgi:sortase A
MRTALRALSTVLILSGTLLVVDAVLTVVWQEPVSALYARVTQGQLGGDLDELEQAELPPLERRVLERLPAGERRDQFLARSLKRRLDEGDAAGRLLIPEIGADFVVVDGTSSGALRKGPGLFPSNPWPGGRGTTAIAGHRTTYAAPFRDVDDLRRGDEIEVRMPYGSFFYEVERTRIVQPDDVWVLDRVSYDRLVLSACHPLYSAAQRIIVFARLVRSEPRGAARRV